LLDAFITHGNGGHYVINRMKNADQILTSKIIDKMKELCQQFEGRDYDLTFEWLDNRNAV